MQATRCKLYMMMETWDSGFGKRKLVKGEEEKGTDSVSR